jgi:phospholipid/cholesterol/gamma-HCH transport system substrate-binding protein
MVASIYFIGRQKSMFGTNITINCMFKDVKGLQRGNNVRFSGINVGTVDNIIIQNDTTIRVEMIVDADVRKFIRTDAAATIGSEGLMGNKVVNILPGTSHMPSVRSGDFIQTSQPMDIDDILKNLRSTSDHAVTIGKDVSDIIKELKSGKGTIGMLLQDEQLSAELRRSLLELKKIGLIIDHVHQGRGTLGMLLMDESLAITLKNTMKDIDKSVHSIDRGAEGFSDNMDALKNSFLFRGYFRRKAKKEAMDKKEKAQSQSDSLRHGIR